VAGETDFPGKMGGLLVRPALELADLLRLGQVHARELADVALRRLEEGEDGLPLGVQLVGRPAGEASLLALAGQTEEARPWKQRLSPMTRGR
jgi:Asp-tRNA(Asn)/Glu-tRNA(Gln) amidotransferase A subunit family amidase